MTDMNIKAGTDPEDEIIESDDKSYLRVNLRKVGPEQKKTAQRFRRQFRQKLPERNRDPREKIDYIYRVDFASGGLQALTRTQTEFETLAAPALRERAEMNALVYTRQFDELLTKAEANYREDGWNIDRRRRFVDALLLTGDMERALARCEAFISTERPEGADPHAVHYARTLLRGGFGPHLGALRPDLAMQLPDYAPFSKFRKPRKPVADVHCINLDRDVERLKRAEAMLSPGMNFHRSAGVSGAIVPDCLLAHAGMEVTVPRRAQIGCHLGHIAAWETIAAKDEADTYSLVAEDDAVFMMGPPLGLREAILHAERLALDILFVNWEPTRYLPRAKGPQDLTVFSVDETIERAANRNFPGWGGQGYLITPRAAAKMIKIAFRVGIVAPLDWQIALYAMETVDPAVLTNSRYGDAPRRIAEARAEDDAAHRLKGGVLNLPLLIQSDFGYTAHNYEVGLS